MITDEEAISHTKNWIRNVVIGLNLCPFAATVVKQDAVRYTVLRSHSLENCLLELANELETLNNNESIETSIIILPDSFKDFNHYLDLVAAADEFLSVEAYEGVYQIASFHPQYTFATSTINDAADFTNRSIYPMLHILREDSVEKALEQHKDPDSIPDRNIKFTREKGVEYMKMLRDACL